MNRVLLTFKWTTRSVERVPLFKSGWHLLELQKVTRSLLLLCMCQKQCSCSSVCTRVNVVACVACLIALNVHYLVYCGLVIVRFITIYDDIRYWIWYCRNMLGVPVKTRLWVLSLEENTLFSNQLQASFDTHWVPLSYWRQSTSIS